MPFPTTHILSYAHHLRGGGVERALLRLAADWTAAGRRVTLVLGDDAGPLRAELPAAVRTIVLGNASRSAMILALPHIVRDERPDVLFCPGNHFTSIAALTRLRLGRGCPPIVAKMSNAVERGDHGLLADTGHRVWLALHRRFLDHLIAMTQATAIPAARATGMAGRTSVIANPPARPIPDAPAPALPTGRYILGVGRLMPQKRWDRLIAVLPRLADARIELVILGEGPERDALTRQARALGIAARVHLPGHAADPLPAMARASVVALTSSYEGVPGVLREALSVGTPVVATMSSPAVAEIVDHAELGTIVPLDDANALVSALDRWLAPDAVRPAPVAPPGVDSANRYLALFDALVTARRSVIR